MLLVIPDISIRVYYISYIRVVSECIIYHISECYQSVSYIRMVSEWSYLALASVRIEEREREEIVQMLASSAKILDIVNFKDAIKLCLETKQTLRNSGSKCLGT